MIAMGVLHLAALSTFAKAVPGYLPHPTTLVLISGVCEIAGGIGLVFPATRRPASLGLIALYIAVFPANVDMALHADRWLSPNLQFLLWLRLPFQLAFITWAWAVGQE
jgi:uncharacterized membrane protein